MLEDGIELRWILGVLRRWWWLILLCTALAGGAAYYITGIIPPVYEANFTLLVEPSKNTISSQYNAIIAAERLALTYSEMLTSRPVLEAVISELNLEETPAELSKKISTSYINNTQLIKCTIQEETPEQAAQLANVLAVAFTEYIHDLAMERYTSSITSAQEKMDVSAEAIQATQAQIDNLRLLKSENEAELGRVQGLLTQYLADLRTLQANYHSFKLSITQYSDKVHIVEPAQIPPSQTKSPYTATVTLLFDESLLTGGSGSTPPNRTLLASTYGSMLYGQSVLSTVIDKTGLDVSTADLAKVIEAHAIVNTQLLQVSVQDAEQSKAIQIANTLAETFIEQVKTQLSIPYMSQLSEMETQIETLSTLVEDTQSQIRDMTAQNAQASADLEQMEMLLAEYKDDHRELRADYDSLLLTSVEAADAVYLSERADIPTEEASNRLLYVGLAAMVGLVVGLGFTFIREYLDDTIKTPEDVEKLLGLSTLGKIGSFSQADRRVVVMSEPRSPVGEDFRMLASNIRFATLDQPVQSLVVTSPSPGDGKSVVLANLAAIMARAETNIIIIDADLRLPKLHKLFGKTSGEGLAESLIAGSPNGFLQDVSVNGLKLLTSGKLPGNPSEVVGSERIQYILNCLRQQADLLLIDSPPVLPFADASLLASQSDGVLLVLRASKTRRKAAQDALQNLRQAGARVLGVVLNVMPARADGYYRYTYYSVQQSKNKLRWQFWKH
jgi:polysaccharide biosynthesis transport protein